MKRENHVEKRRLQRFLRALDQGVVQYWATEAFRALLDHRTWTRHPQPFNKTHRGAQRRAERRFLSAQMGELA